MYGLEEYYNGLIAEAKSPEEIKKILKYQFVDGKKVPPFVFDCVFNADPTKKKSYTRWVLSQWENYSDSIVNSIEDRKLNRMFKTFKERAAQGLDLTNMENFDKAMEMIPDIDPCLEKEGDPNAPENQFDIVYDSPQWTIAVPHTYEADKKLGRGCRWCTAGAFRNGESYWKQYSAEGTLWVNFDRTKHEVCPMDNKEYPYKRYQLLFEFNNWNGELMDSNDYRVDVSRIDMPDEVIEFYESQNKRYGDILRNGVDRSNEDAISEYEEERVERAVYIYNNNETDASLMLMPERNQDLDLNVPYFAYDMEDSSDPIDYSPYDPNDCFICSFDDIDVVILKDVNDRLHCYYKGGHRYWSESSYVDMVDIQGAPNGYKVVVVNERTIYIGNSLSENGSTFELSTDSVGAEGEPSSAFVNEQISQMARQCGIQNAANLMFIEIVWENGFHTLVSHNKRDAEYKVIIRKDSPKDGEQFVAENINGQISINGKYFSHNALETNRYIMYEDLTEICGHQIYIVSVGDSGELGFNLYDGQSKKLVFEQDLATCVQIKLMPPTDSEATQVSALKDMVIQKNDSTLNTESDETQYVLCSDDQTWFIFDAKLMKVVTDKFLSITRASLFSNFYRLSNDSSECFLFYVSPTKGKLYGPFKSYSSGLLSSSKVLVRILDSNRMNILDGETGKYILPNNVTNWGKLSQFRSDDGLMVLQTEGPDSSQYSLYNYAIGKVVATDLSISKNGTQVVPKKGDCDDWKIFFTDGKYNIVKWNRVLLPKNVETIYASSSSMNLCPIEDEGRMWFVKYFNNAQQIKLLPTNAGIDMKVLTHVRSGTDHFQFTYTDKDLGDLLVIYAPEKPYKDCVWAYDFQHNIISEDSAAYQRVKALFFPQGAQIQEQFKKSLKIITDFYKDR